LPKLSARSSKFSLFDFVMLALRIVSNQEGQENRVIESMAKLPTKLKVRTGGMK